MKRRIAAVLLAALMVSLGGCGPAASQSSAPKDSSAVSENSVSPPEVSDQGTSSHDDESQPEEPSTHLLTETVDYFVDSEGNGVDKDTLPPGTNGVTLTLEVPANWQLDGSILYDTEPPEELKEALAAAYSENKLKVGEIGVLITGLSYQMPAEELFGILDSSYMPLDYLVQERLELDGQVVYHSKYLSYPGGGVIEKWYVNYYLFHTEQGLLGLLLYSLEENDPEIEALFAQIVSSAQIELVPN